jgi:hypothetical protein
MELLTEAALPDREQGLPRYRRSVPVGGRPLTSMGIAQARLPGGGSVNLMRVMQTSSRGGSRACSRRVRSAWTSG